MSEYIKREDVERAVFGHLDSIGEYRLMNVPSADVVEVVRCKDCKYYRHDVDKDGGSWDCCSEHGEFVTPTDYCSYGERKDGERTIFIDETIDETCGYGEDGESE